MIDIKMLERQKYKINMTERKMIEIYVYVNGQKKVYVSGQ